MKQVKSYKETHSLEDRKQRVKEQKERYAEMIPIIVEKGKKCTLPDLVRIKYLLNKYFRYLVNSGFKLNEFKATIKKKLLLDERTSTLFLYCGKTLINEGIHSYKNLDSTL